jgi:hypothetical protein
MSRRGFLTKSSMAAATGAAVAAAASTGLLSVQNVLAAPAQTAATAAPTEADMAAVGSDVVAHVRNASTGEISVMVGEHEVVTTDRALVARLLKSARAAR